MMTAPVSLIDLISPNPLAWWDGSDASTMYDATSGGSLSADAGAVKRWEDKSGNGYHATQSDTALSPTRQAGAINGLNVLRFDGSNDQLVHTADADTVTIFAMLQLRSLQTGYRGVISLGPSSASGALLLANESTNRWGTFTTTNRPASSTRTTDLRLFAMTGNASGGSFYLNGTSDGIYAGNSIGQAVKHIGGQTGQSMHADLCEIVVYSAILNTDDRNTITSHLLSKWT